MARKKTKSKKCNGYFVLFDIKDSVARKKAADSNWVDQTTHIYSEFDALTRNICDELATLKQPVAKNMGDAVMAFFESDDVSEETASKFTDMVMEFRMKIHESALNNWLHNIKLNSVVAYLDNIYRVNGDVLGVGIDFAFRLEKFSDLTHVVINNGLANLLGCDKTGKYKLFDAIECSKSMKGWSTPENFFILTSMFMLKQEAPYLRPSSAADDVFVEMLIYVIQAHTSGKASGELDKAIDWAKPGKEEK